MDFFVKLDGLHGLLLLSRLVVFDSMRPHRRQPTRLPRPWDSPGKNTGVGCHCPPPGDLPDPGIEPRSPALQADSLPLSHQGSPYCDSITIQKHIVWDFPGGPMAKPWRLQYRGPGFDFWSGN